MCMGMSSFAEVACGEQTLIHTRRGVRVGVVCRKFRALALQESANGPSQVFALSVRPERNLPLQ